MARIPRKYLDTSFIHVIVQGIDKQNIFLTDKLKYEYKHLLKENLLHSKIEVMAYCIMSNHTHLLLFVNDISELSKSMQKINTSYARIYNKANKRVGYVFRDRYYSQKIKNEKHLCNCMVYIHNNPVKAKLVKTCEQYKFSSYNEYLYKKDIISDETIKLIFQEDNYLDFFTKLHQNKCIDDIADIVEEYQDYHIIINSYQAKYHVTIQDIMQNKQLFNLLLLELRHASGLSIRKMAEIFKMNKNQINKIINMNL